MEELVYQVRAGPLGEVKLLELCGKSCKVGSSDDNVVALTWYRNDVTRLAE